MDRNDNKGGDILFPKVVMAATDVSQGIPSALESRKKLPATHLR